MPRFRRFPLAFAISVPFLAGCLFVKHRTIVSRQDEERRPIQYENDRAREIFTSRANNDTARQRDAATNVVAVPFLFFWSSTTTRSEAAYFNDQVSACDTDGDGLISQVEADKYNQSFGNDIDIRGLAEVEMESSSEVQQASGSKPAKTSRK